MAELSNVLTVNIVTPNGLVYDHHADMVVVKTIAGELGIMANHEPVVAPLVIGEIRVKRTDNPGHEDAIAVNGGFMEMSGNVASIVADSAERERDIDLTRAEAARARAQRRIDDAKTKSDPDELQRAQVALQRAINRIHVKTGK
ncbi:F0F1 ATP synthase subunit epsilon [Lacticaseibacillus manihotivorans]|jgi:F-type H+-transporting ATPase subunit epsilon|uniref:ATP synthase epsilon chain n=2 Tax=Lacticaseibacillus manihotivorans TaxID=88233 RepID=A0A0R1RDS9_9LACO|nr:F0F1 ATP synthase subunit epsilon [Lacticaseibacillus manihotivorans]KRL53396.1 F0F1 ATP synthase subunit epsilon [Lacticaseibacillus manihotivorans DSM 13343 = JCM 12514]QFQ91993.1 F0F1 ATP synthase subunit epsilon [Lacticaseibacillus manihotivorans]